MSAVPPPLPPKRSGLSAGCIIALVCMGAVLLICLFLGVVALFLPQTNRARIHAQEASAISEVRTINQAEIQYQVQFNKYATALSQLGPPAPGSQEGPEAAGLIPSKVAAGSDRGYNFAIKQTTDGYAVTAVPETYGVTGRRSFYSDQTAIIRQNSGQEPATAQSSEIK